MDFDAKMEEGLSAAEHGRLENGLSYYVRCNSKPKMKAKLVLAINVGSILEEENELGVAHMVEHLAFGATKKYHDVTKFLEGIGAGFRTCQNASTSADETIYELTVPTDKPEPLSQAISVLAEFSSEIRISVEELDKERVPIIEEYRQGRNALGRTLEANWHLILDGSKYADSLPIGTLEMIREVSFETVKKFYKKWYALRHMALIVVGDFPDTKRVVDLIKTHFGHKKSNADSPEIPKFVVPHHKEPKILCHVDPEASMSSVKISFKSSVDEVNTIASYRKSLVAHLFRLAMMRRFTKELQKDDLPYHSCSLYPDDNCRAIKILTINADCIEKGTVTTLKSMLMEIARVRPHGFSEREISLQRIRMLSTAESVYLTRHELTSSFILEQYVQHFLRQEPIFNVEDEVDIRRTILPNISASEVSDYSQGLRTTDSCVIMVVEPQAGTTMDDVKTTMLFVNSLEGAGNISPWEDEDIPEEIVTSEPNLAVVVKESEFSNIGATELILSNGMRVCYKCTDFLKDEIRFSGNAFGGLSEVPENDYMSCLYGEAIAKRIGLFGFKPSVLADMLVGKDVRVDTGVGHYMRYFTGSCSPTHLKTALQLVYQLFSTSVVPVAEDVEVLMQLLEENVEAEGTRREPF